MPAHPRHARTRNSHRSVLLVLLDGVGIGRRDASVNPFFAAPLPFLTDALDGTLPSLRTPRILTGTAVAVPLNATLGVPGLPQSGTGQAALYCGVNAARHIGKHFGPYLYSTLKPVVAERNLFRRLLRAGVPAEQLALANAFPRRFFEYMEGAPTRMVAGMYAALTAGIPFRDIRALEAGEAVSTDLTAARWKDIGHPEAPVLAPGDAGRQLARIAAAHRFTLFEYFQTDKAGHERSLSHAAAILATVDDFLRGVFEESDRERLLVLVTSDHGNIEDISTKSHTRHPVPLFAFGPAASAFAFSIRSICDISSAVEAFLREDG